MYLPKYYTRMLRTYITMIINFKLTSVNLIVCFVLTSLLSTCHENINMQSVVQERTLITTFQE